MPLASIVFADTLAMSVRERDEPMTSAHYPYFQLLGVSMRKSKLNLVLFHSLDNPRIRLETNLRVINLSKSSLGLKMVISIPTA